MKKLPDKWDIAVLKIDASDKVQLAQAINDLIGCVEELQQMMGSISKICDLHLGRIIRLEGDMDSPRIVMHPHSHIQKCPACGGTWIYEPKDLTAEQK